MRAHSLCVSQFSFLNTFPKPVTLLHEGVQGRDVRGILFSYEV